MIQAFRVAEAVGTPAMVNLDAFYVSHSMEPVAIPAPGEVDAYLPRFGPPHRLTFARAMEEAGVPRTRRKLYLGHGASDVTDLYERHEITAFLAEDARRLRAVLTDGRVLRVV